MSTNTVRAILIDPEKRTVSEIQIEDGYKPIIAALQSESFTTAAHLSGSLSKGFDAVYASDDMLAEREDTRFWFQIDADRNPPSSHPVAGRGIALGTDKDGEGCVLRISVEELTTRVTFTQRKFRGFDIDDSGRSGFDLVVTVNAPIIETE